MTPGTDGVATVPDRCPEAQTATHTSTASSTRRGMKPIVARVGGTVNVVGQPIINVQCHAVVVFED